MSVKSAFVLAVVLPLIAVGSLWGTYQWSDRYFYSEVAEGGRDALDLYVENVRGWLGKFQALPRIYAQNPNVVALLRDPEDTALIATVNNYLSEWNLATGAADTYLLNSEGTALAASNWADDVTFVGKNYAYRPYYKQAMQGRLGRFFALGTASKQRGYYFSYPVHAGSKVFGVIVVKVGVEEIEDKLRSSSHEFFITGPEGVILLAGDPEWRLKTLVPLDQAARNRIKANRQFDLDTLAPIGPFGSSVAAGDGFVKINRRESGAGKIEFMHLSMPMTVEDWVLHVLIDTRFARNQIVTTVLLVASILLGVGLIATVIWQRRRRLVELLAERERARAILEKTVDERTADLRSSNILLEEEVGERKAAEAELRHTQRELVQAGKLAALGQMSAALSHEFNQPLAAIRTYAENAETFLDRGHETEARENLAEVVTLTERMADLSKHLSNFARKPQESSRAVSLSGVLTQTLALLEGRLQAGGLEPRVDAPSQEVWVHGGHIRLQQVIMNLITNALDAMKGVAEPLLSLRIECDGPEVRLIVEDNGVGLPAGQSEQIFDPFFTTKEVGAGLGLGLSISFNIVKDFGGSIEACNRESGGARFTLALCAAEPAAEPAGEAAQ